MSDVKPISDELLSNFDSHWKEWEVNKDSEGGPWALMGLGMGISAHYPSIRERLRIAETPYCLGVETITRLANEGQLIAAGHAFIAASDLYKKNPYEKLKLADAIVKAAASVLSEDGVREQLSCYVQGIELMNLIGMYHAATSGEGI